MAPNQPDDSALINGRYALEGRVVTMNATDTVINHGRVYIDNGRIVGVSPATAPPPDGHAADIIIKTGGTIYPGLIDLHNHLSYNVLRLWNVPTQYSNRDQWGTIPEYRKLISGPMNILGRTPDYVKAIVRYVECKCLLGGVTTSQGIRLFSNAGITRYYRGFVRNAEQPDAEDLPAAESRISDVEASDSARFLERLRAKEDSCLLLHLSEGTNDQARKHFQSLRLSPNSWAITSALAGIHCIALQPEDFQIMASNGASMIWSPFSNLLLYGKTADIKAAKEHGLRMGIGSDWSPSGSKNLLGELKVARLVSEAQGGIFSDKELVAMATRNAAAILKWNKTLGSIEVGKHADLLIISGRQNDAYAHLLQSAETDIRLVVIGGIPRFGTTTLMKHFDIDVESWTVGNKKRLLNSKQPAVDLAIGELTVREARDRLVDALKRLPELARNLEIRGFSALGSDPETPSWFLVLDHDEPAGIAIRPHLPFDGTPTAVTPAMEIAAVPLSGVVESMKLDPLTVADDSTFLRGLQQQRNLPAYIKDGLAGLYSHATTDSRL